MCEAKLIDKSSQELMNALALQNTLNGLARVSVVRMYGHIFRRDNGDVLRRELDFKAVGRRGRMQPKMTWRRQVKEHIDQIGRKKEDATNRTKLQNIVYKLSGRMT